MTSGEPDDGGQPDTAKRIAQEFIVSDKVKVLAGFTFTPVALAVAPLATEAKVPQVVMAAGTKGLVLAQASRRFDDADLDGLLQQLVHTAQLLGARARRLQTGFVSRELLLATAGAALILGLALAVR